MLGVLLASGCASGPAPATAPEGDPVVEVAEAPAEKIDDETLPDTPRALALLDEGRARMQEGQAPRALELFDEAARADPGLGLAHLEWAIAAQHAGLAADRVRPRLTRALSLLPDNPRAHYVAAAFEESQGNLDAAREGYQLVLELRPSYAEASLRLGQAELARGAPAEALARFDDVLRADPDHVPALLGRTDAAEALGDLEKAESSLRHLVRIHPDRVAYRQRLIRFLREHDLDKEARAEQKQLDRVDPRKARKLRELRKSRR